jgi:hypothetical protein
VAVRRRPARDTLAVGARPAPPGDGEGRERVARTDAAGTRPDDDPSAADRSGSARDDAQEAARSTALRRAAALGLLGYSLIHLLIGWLALTLAWFQSSPSRAGEQPTDSSGALALLARHPAGDALLWVLAVGLAALCLWQASEVLRHHRSLPPPGDERRDALLQLVKTVGTAAFYGYLAVSAVRTALGHGQGRGKEQHTLAGVLGIPGGQALVTAVGVVVAGIGVYLVRKGVRSDFTSEIDLGTVTATFRTAARRVCQVGFVLKGVALVLSGVVVGWAAITARPDRGDGMDGALRVVAGQPFGQWLLTVIALGLAAFAVYCLVRARHPVG